MAQELLTLPEHLSFSGIRVTRSLVLCVFFRSLFVLFLLAIVLSVLLRYMVSGCPLVSSNSSYNHTRVRNVKYVTYVFWVFFLRSMPYGQCYLCYPFLNIRSFSLTIIFMTECSPTPYHFICCLVVNSLWYAYIICCVEVFYHACLLCTRKVEYVQCNIYFVDHRNIYLGC